VKYLNEMDVFWNGKYCEYASRNNGDLECLKYLHENGCPLNENCCENASFYGQLECLKYLHENGYPLNENCRLYASQNGHLEVLNYLLVNMMFLE